MSALWPGSSLQSMQALRRPWWEDYEYTYIDDNRWGWFRDGWSSMDRNPKLDRAFYLAYDPNMIYEPLPQSPQASNGIEKEAQAIVESRGVKNGAV